MKRPADNLVELQAQMSLALQTADRHKAGRDVAEKLLEQKASELYRSNEALLKVQENLQQDIAQAIDEIQESNARLRRTLEEKSTFIGSLSHELRTPLNAVIGLSELLQKMPMGILQKDYVDTIFDSASSLVRLINGVLDIAKIEAGKANLDSTPVDCSKVVNRLKKMFALKAESRNNKITVDVDSDIPNYLLLHEGSYTQILTNLVNNALKNTDNGEVVISLCIKDGVNGLSLHTIVRDTGIGIAKHQVEKIFLAYEQFGNRDQGVGLGLAICKSLIKLMQGDLTCESELGIGSQFSFFIPTSKCLAQDLAKTSHPTGHALETLKVLIAEDNPINQKVLLAQFMQFGIEPTIVDNGQLALDKLTESNYDVLFLDLQMPVMDGETALRKIRSELVSGNQQYCVALTATTYINKHEQMLEVGFDDFLSKPLILGELESALTRIVRAIETQGSNDKYSEQKALNRFDISFLESQFGDAAANVFRQLAPVFLEHSFQELDELHSAVVNNDISRVKILSHSLKGALSSMGQLDLAAQLGGMENQTGTIDLKKALDKVAIEMAELRGDLEQTLAAYSDES
ncbi:MAG: signal transduction histidine kinase/DNA-binding response OmpR family regulator [Arenicella sp.]|jgi:signal transduction histidine kinase/DNA-binding response OmpR family regulator